MERNREMMAAVKARRGEAQMVLIRKTAEAMVLSKIAMPPAEQFRNPGAHRITTKLLDEALQAWMIVALRSFIPNIEEISEADAEKLSSEFLDEIMSMSKMISVTLDVGMRDLTGRGF
jgi:hypothetical protein